MMVRVSPMTAASFAATLARSRLGMAMAAMIPMMATTIRSSMRVNPFSRITLPCRHSSSSRQKTGERLCAPPGSAENLLEGRTGGRQNTGRAAARGEGVVGRPDDAAVVGAEGTDAGLVGHGRLRAVAEDPDRARRGSARRGRAPEIARVTLLRSQQRDGTIEERRSCGRVVRDAGATRGQRQTADFAVEPRVSQLIRCLARNDRTGIADRTGLVAVI